MNKPNKLQVQTPTHPFRRYVAGSVDNANDEFYVVEQSSIIGYRGNDSGRVRKVERVKG